MRLVDADAFKAEGRKLYREAGWDLRDVHYSQMDVECNIDMMPTIEAEPAKHGRWIKVDKHTVKCSGCGNYLDMRGVNAGRGDANYCPNCGEKMDGEEDD